MGERVAAGALVVGGTLRLTRFVTQDWLGEWWLVGPAKRWAIKPEYRQFEKVVAEESAGADPNTRWVLSDGTVTENAREHVEDSHTGPWSWQGKLVKGLDCPFCVGFWIGGAVLLGTILFARTPVLGPVWRFGLAALGLNYVVGHVSSRIDG